MGCLGVPLSDPDTPDMHFLLEKEPAFDDHHFLHHRYDRYVAIFTNRRSGLNKPADRHVFDFNALAY